MGHDFNFDGGEYLTKMGASWFVSYMYYLKIDNMHLNWDKIKTANTRINVFDKTTKYHKFWLNEVLKVSNDKLNTNKIGINAYETKRMANQLLNLQ